MFSFGDTQKHWDGEIRVKAGLTGLFLGKCIWKEVNGTIFFHVSIFKVFLGFYEFNWWMKCMDEAAWGEAGKPKSAFCIL